MRLRYLPFLLLAALAVPAWGADTAALEKQFHDQIEQLLPGMAAKEIPDRKDPQQTLEKLCFQAGTPGKDAEREALSKAIMSFAGAETAKPARVWLLRKIETLGREEVVEPLAKLMHDDDPEIADLARRALANNPSEKALAALRTELGEAKKPAWKAAIVNALAWRHDAASVEEFVKLSQKKNPVVATAAISALGEVGSEKAAEALADLRKSAPAELKAAVVDASLRAAERLLAGGKAEPAKAIYTDLLAADQPEQVRIAGLSGLAKTPGADTLATVLKHATGDDAHLRLIAARCLARGPAETNATRQITEAMRKANPEAKAALIEVLGDRGDNQALPTVMQYMEDKDADVRVAAYEAIGKLGNAATVRVLYIQGAKSEGADRDVIRKSLANLKGAGVDEAILKAMESAQGPARIELIMAVWGRRITAAKPALLGMADDPDEGTRVAVLTAMERLANEADLPKLVQMLVASKSEASVKAAEEAVAAVCRRGDPEKCVAPLAEAMAKADPAGKVAVVRLLSRLQGQAALTAVRAAAKSDEPKAKEAALAALAQWKPVSVTTWLYAGPFRQEGKGVSELFDTAFPPETDIASGTWKPLKNPGAEGRFDLGKVAKGDNCCVYVKTVIQSERKQDVVLGIGSDDGVKVWLNGKVVHANNAMRAVKCDEDQAKVTLNEGENALLLKITQGGSDFAFCCVIKAAEGGPADGVRFEAR